MSTIREQMTRYAGRRWRMCVYVTSGDQWAGFVESAELVGFTGRHATRRGAMIECARLVAREVAL